MLIWLLARIIMKLFYDHSQSLEQVYRSVGAVLSLRASIMDTDKAFRDWEYRIEVKKPLVKGE